MRFVVLSASFCLAMAGCAAPTPPAATANADPNAAAVAHHAPITGSHIRSASEAAAQPGLNSVSGGDYAASRVGNNAAQGSGSGGGGQ